MNNNEKSRAARLSENLEKLMTHHNLSFRGLSKATGIAQPHLARLSKGEHASPGLEVLDKIANFFGVTISQLIGDQPLTHLPELAYPNIVPSENETPKDNTIPGKSPTTPPKWHPGIQSSYSKIQKTTAAESRKRTTSPPWSKTPTDNKQEQEGPPTPKK